MEKLHHFLAIIRLMRDYQHEHNIESQCLYNTQYAYDKAIELGIEVKVIAVISIGKINDTDTAITTGHVVLEYEGDIIDPSYQQSCQQNITYYETIDEAIKACPKNLQSLIYTKKYIRRHLHFVRYAANMNAGRTHLARTNRYYLDQKQIVEAQFSLIEKFYSILKSTIPQQSIP